MGNIIKVCCDGGSRGNPGKAAAAFVVEEEGKIIFSEAKYLGIQTNNFAEYSAVLSALYWLKANKQKLKKEIIFILDSELVVKQITGAYKVKNNKLKIIFQEIKNVLESFSLMRGKQKIIFKNVSREKNKMADFLVNQKLDSIV
jgi:ribonuclease HI